MSDLNYGKATVSDLTGGVSNYSVNQETLDSPSYSEAETYYDFPDASRNLGYYKNIPELKKAIDALVIWVAGKGVNIESIRDKVILERLSGWGEDSFQSIIKNLIRQKKIHGDAFAEIIRGEEGTLINLKPLNTAHMRVVTNNKGMIIRYEQRTATGKKPSIKFKPEDILHLCNDRIGDEVHGTSVIDACKWIIDARNEAMADWRRISHRSTIRVMYVDVDDSAKITTLKTQYKEGINKGEILILPAKKGDVEFEDLQLPPVDAFLRWIQYLENIFYQAVGVPRVIASSQEFSEASSKVGYMTFEPTYTDEQTETEADIWNQLGIRLKFNRPPSLHGVMSESEQKNTGQVGVQPNEVQASAGRTE